MPQELINDKSTLAPVMAWCHQATSHYLNQCWSSSKTPYGITRPQGVNTTNQYLIPLQSTFKPVPWWWILMRFLSTPLALCVAKLHGRFRCITFSQLKSVDINSQSSTVVWVVCNSCWISQMIDVFIWKCQPIQIIMCLLDTICESLFIINIMPVWVCIHWPYDTET